MSAHLPPLDAPPPGTDCTYCGEPMSLHGFCATCYERLAHERRIESGNNYRRAAQVALEMSGVRQRVENWKKERPMDVGVSLESLLALVQRAALHTEQLRERYQGSTNEVLENVGLELQHATALVADEVRILRRAGVVTT